MNIKKLSYPILLIVAAMTLAACHDDSHDSKVSSASSQELQISPKTQSATPSSVNVPSASSQQESTPDHSTNN
ncbi:MAG: hypothetical protein CENE_01211 [Candidatus Celerinatantimonas neptuna]|nr:MAG: hypothetical protein CENE_01211 [Candidatus Celerinatantimonas neptuna]